MTSGAGEKPKRRMKKPMNPKAIAIHTSAIACDELRKKGIV
jgi:hypothetical protein